MSRRDGPPTRRIIYENDENTIKERDDGPIPASAGDVRHTMAIKLGKLRDSTRQLLSARRSANNSRSRYKHRAYHLFTRLSAVPQFVDHVFLAVDVQWISSNQLISRERN